MIGLGFDGTTINAAIIRDGGEIFAPINFQPSASGYRDWLLSIQAQIAPLQQQAGSQAKLGFAFPGIVKDGVVAFTHLSMFEGATLQRDLQSTLGMAVTVCDHGDALVTHEWHHGVARETKTAVAMWIGNSCHGGISINGQTVSGAHGATANWAHLQLPSPVPHELDGRQCWCGRTGCLESFLSTARLEDDYENLTGERRNAAEIAAAAAGSDIVADSVIQVFEDRLGRATATIISLIDPEVIVIGGANLQLDRLCERIPRKWPGYVQVDRSATRMRATADSNAAILSGAAGMACRSD